MSGQLTQLFPPKPTLTEKNVGSLAGKVYIVTGGNAGVGLELVRILYTQGSTVYIIGRSTARVAAAVTDIEASPTSNPGKVKSLIIDLGDLTTIASGVSKFLAQENRLDVLFNNAGIAQVPAGSVTAQGEEAHMGTNCLGHFLLTKLLCPILIQTAKSVPRGSVCVSCLQLPALSIFRARQAGSRLPNYPRATTPRTRLATTVLLKRGTGFWQRNSTSDCAVTVSSAWCKPQVHSKPKDGTRCQS